jgi:large subunit ribosomal protein L17
MHRHGYKGKKFGRERDQREALMKSLANSLVLHESIETTLPKAKEVSRYTEKLITKAKVGGLHNRRQIIQSLMTLEAAHKLVDEIAPKLGARNSGYLSVKRSSVRRGDGAQLAKVGFVDDLAAKAKPVKAEPKKIEAKRPAIRKAKPAGVKK